VAIEYSGDINTHQNGSVITTSKAFLNDERAKDITESLKQLNQA
jgi:agmatine/peptidylarginine deiminase